MKCLFMWYNVGGFKAVLNIIGVVKILIWLGDFV